ncbi:hypothetical protein Taro_005556 [Colocasia esculenta]|uniref:Hydroxymethylglutaryl-CoA reductase (NADPH) n=1 Tax=Colocasia esculenta TaxID=4460 RepID=A0A843TQ82_COLES|nr:hypothetical protein [Colocasia esculenta]
MARGSRLFLWTSSSKPPRYEHQTPHRAPAAASAEAMPVKASDALPLHVRLNKHRFFFPLIFLALYYLMLRWREKVRVRAPLNVLTFLDVAAVLAFVSSVLYLLNFFKLGLFQPGIVPRGADEDGDVIAPADDPRCPPLPFGPLPLTPSKMAAASVPSLTPADPVMVSAEDEEIVQAVLDGTIPSYSLESWLCNCRRAAGVRRDALRRATGRSLDWLPLCGFDYKSILGQCCEIAVGYVTLPVGIAGPMLLDRKLYHVPMATTEGCLVASVNRGLKAIRDSGGSMSVVLRDSMTRAPAVRFGSAKRAVELRVYLEDPLNFDTLSAVFNKSSRFARL